MCAEDTGGTVVRVVYTFCIYTNSTYVYSKCTRTLTFQNVLQEAPAALLSVLSHLPTPSTSSTHELSHLTPSSWQKEHGHVTAPAAARCTPSSVLTHDLKITNAHPRTLAAAETVTGPCAHERTHAHTHTQTHYPMRSGLNNEVNAAPFATNLQERVREPHEPALP